MVGPVSLLQNPKDSGTVAQIDPTRIASDGAAHVETFDNPQITSLGTSIQGVNLRSDKPNAHSLVIGYGGVYSGGTTEGQKLIPISTVGGNNTTT